VRTGLLASLLLSLLGLACAPSVRTAEARDAAGRAAVRLEDAQLDRVTAAHSWAMSVDLSANPPTVAKALVIHGNSVLGPPHVGFLVLKGPAPPVCNPTPCGFNTSGASNPFHWIDP